jgi:hypothetical protein
VNRSVIGAEVLTRLGSHVVPGRLPAPLDASMDPGLEDGVEYLEVRSPGRDPQQHAIADANRAPPCPTDNRGSRKRAHIPAVDEEISLCFVVTAKGWKIT